MNISKNTLYFDNASTTKVDERVLKEMLPFFTELYGNASSNHDFGKVAKQAIERARAQVSDIINAQAEEIFFTSGSTESINWALKGFLEENPDKGNHIITVKTEHKAVLNTCEYLESKGYNVTYLNVDENGLLSLPELEKSIKKETALIVVMYVNNEIGVIQPIKEIGAIAKKNNIIFFCDATQAVGKVPVDVVHDNIDMLCLSGHKIKGPKGVGVLFKSRGIALTPLIHGGGQEKGLRGGTYNTPLIAGLGKACQLALLEFEKNNIDYNERRQEMELYFKKNNIGIVNFKNVKTAPHIMSIRLNNIDAEEYLLRHKNEFVASTGSACNAELISKSHVLKAIFKNSKENIIRVSF